MHIRLFLFIFMINMKSIDQSIKNRKKLLENDLESKEIRNVDHNMFFATLLI